MALQDQIERFREQEAQEVALILTQRPLLMQLLSVWQRVPITVKTELNGEDVEWDTLWKHYRIRFKDIATIMGVAETTAKQVFAQARDLQLVYPDNSIHRVGKVMIQRRLKTALSV